MGTGCGLSRQCGWQLFGHESSRETKGTVLERGLLPSCIMCIHCNRMGNRCLPFESFPFLRECDRCGTMVLFVTVIWRDPTALSRVTVHLDAAVSTRQSESSLPSARSNPDRRTSPLSSRHRRVARPSRLSRSDSPSASELWPLRVCRQFVPAGSWSCISESHLSIRVAVRTCQSSARQAEV